jgi:hypothetical protein
VVLQRRRSRREGKQIEREAERARGMGWIWIYLRRANAYV